MKKFWGGNRYLSEWILLLTGLSLVVAVVGLSAYQDQEDIGKREHERLASHAEMLNRNLGNALQIVDRALLHIRTDLPQWRQAEDGMQPISDRLRGFAEAMPSVRTMLVLDASGTIVAASRAELLGQNFAYRAYFTQARDHPDPDILYISPPFRNVLGIWAINLVRVILGPEGEFSGILVAGIDPASLREQLGALLYHKDMWAAIVHADGLQVVIEPDRPGQDGLNLAQPGSFFSRHMESGQAAQVLTSTVTATGEQRLIALRTVRHPEVPMDKPLVVAIGRDIQALYAPWYRQLRLMGWLLLFLIATTIPGLAYIQHRRRSIETLQAQADAALAQSEHFMRSLIDIIPGMVGYWTRDLRCTFANQAYLEWFGKTQEQMQGIYIHDLMGEALFRKNEPYIRGALAGERQSFERTLTKADGSIGYTWAHYIPDSMDGRVQGFFVLVSDITELKRSEAALRENRRFLRDLIEHSGTIIFAKDNQGRYLLINQMYEQLTGLSRDQVIGHTDMEIYPSSVARHLIDNDQAVMAAVATRRYEEQVGEHYFLTTKFPLFGDNGQVTGVCGISADITEQKEAQTKMEWLANTDMLTRLPNRRHFHEMAAVEVSRAQRLQQPLAALMLDIDHFKAINDNYGHDVGDRVIAFVGEVCRKNLRDIDIAGRLGGEDFAILLPATSAIHAHDVAERLRHHIETHQIAVAAEKQLQFTVSIGYAHSDQVKLNAEQLLKVADQYLYQAKNSGRNRVAPSP